MNCELIGYHLTKVETLLIFNIKNTSFVQILIFKLLNIMRALWIALVLSLGLLSCNQDDSTRTKAEKTVEEIKAESRAVTANNDVCANSNIWRHVAPRIVKRGIAAIITYISFKPLLRRADQLRVSMGGGRRD